MGKGASRCYSNLEVIIHNNKKLQPYNDLTGDVYLLDFHHQLKE